MNVGDNTVRIPKAEVEPLVSVLVPSYKHQKYVIECLESIKNLRYTRLELILSDDCSPDATYELAEQWVQENRGRFERAIAIRQPKNLGVVKNLQFLFDSADGEYLAYIASDDLYLESAITHRLAVLLGNSDVDAVFGNAMQISASGEVLEPEFIPKLIAAQLSSKGLLISSLLLNWCIPGPVMMLRREAVLEGGSLGPLPEGLEGEDAYVYIRLAAHKRLKFVNEVVAKWRFVQGSMSNTDEVYKLTRRYTLSSHKMNRALLTGFDRFAIETVIADEETVRSKKGLAAYPLKRVLFRLITMHLRLIIRVRAMFDS